MTARIAALLALAAPLAAASELAVGSPFDSSQAVPAGIVRAETLELRGIMPSADGMRYCVFDTLRNSSTWAAVSEPSGSFVIRSADPAAEEVTLDESGRIVTLRLRKSKVAALTPEGNAPTHAIAYEPMSRRQPGEPRAPKAAGG
jgi:hypothetical protein